MHDVMATAISGHHSRSHTDAYAEINGRSAFCEAATCRENVQGTIMSTHSGWERCTWYRAERKKWRRLKLPEEQPDRVNKRPEIVVTINFGAGVEANISEYLSELLASRRDKSANKTQMYDDSRQQQTNRTKNTPRESTQRLTNYTPQHTAAYYCSKVTREAVAIFICTRTLLTTPATDDGR